MTIASGNNVAKNEITAQFRADITDIVNSYGKWHSTNWPSGAPASGGSRTNSTPGVLGDNLLAGSTVTNRPLDTDIPYGDASLSQLVLQLRTAASILSRCRYVRLVKNFTTGASAATEFDQTAYAHLSSTWEKTVGSFSTLTGGDLNAAAVLAFVTTLKDEVTAHRNSTVTFVESWCHSNCHSNHSSRNRR